MIFEPIIIFIASIISYNNVEQSGQSKTDYTLPKTEINTEVKDRNAILRGGWDRN